MSKITKIQICRGVYWVEIPDARLYVLCGCPADSVKHLKKSGLIVAREENGITFETGPNALLLSDILVQNGYFSNLSEFPVLQMLYFQGMLVPGHPRNTGIKPLLIGSEEQVKSQMQYIYRGNYGLVSEEEMMDTGVSAETAHEMMRLKLKFAFGKIKSTEDLLDSRIVENNRVEIRNGVFVRRLRVNVFEFQYKGETTIVDLNLGPYEFYEPPYQLGFHNIKREYFAVIHSGEGDGWDINRPCMASILMFQGKIYLIDSGPNIVHSLKALGIGVNEIEGIFHTHAHDDHFAGLTTLMRSDHKIKYFANPLVRASVIKKLAALESLEEESFSNYFEMHDLELEIWNDISGLEVKPIFSPHPVETTIFIFRAICEGGYQSYAHFADIVSLDVLKKMITENASEPGISRDYFEQIKNKYLTKSNLKKLDIGGGMIHGDAEDFRGDTSEKIILSHTSAELTNQQKTIGSGAPFGTVDILIPGYQDYVRRYAFTFLQSYFPSVPKDQRDILLNSPVVTFNPKSILIKRGEINKYVYLILTGDVEMIQSESGESGMMSVGGCVGETSGLTGAMSKETYRAVNFVQTLQIPCGLCLEFVKKNGLHYEIDRLRERREFLKNTWLFGEEISIATQNTLARAMQPLSFPSGEIIALENTSGLFVVRKGKLQLFIGEDVFDIVDVGDFFGESDVLFRTPAPFRFKTIAPVEVYQIQREALLNIPIVHWKLFEIYAKRIKMILSPELSSIPVFQWREEYNTNIQEIDNDHKALFETLHRLYEAIHSGEGESVLQDTLQFLIRYTEDHFTKEEQMMQQESFPDYESHRKKHESLKEEVLSLERNLKAGEIKMDISFIKFFKDWIINHIFTEDRKYVPYLK